MDTDLAHMLGEIQRSLGTIEGMLKGQGEAFQAHVAADALMAADIKKLQLAQANQKGFFTAVGTLSSIVGAAIAYFVDRYLVGR